MFLLDILFPTIMTRGQQNSLLEFKKTVQFDKQGVLITTENEKKRREEKRREEKFKVIKENLRKFKSLAYFQNLSFFRQNNQKISQLQMTD